MGRGSRLTLHLPGGAYNIQCEATPAAAPDAVSLVRADSYRVRGWQSRSYGEKEPALSLTLVVRAPGVRFCTIFGPA